ncbi:BRCT domain-containing protein [Streptosporangium sp. CA-115845]|uniref:BRCT domain-containing protein n=1 Tax=Streptosporangium sp. CA-115845 TaxID=3240071 RepID=UPI003D912A5C
MFEIGENECGFDDVADSAGVGGDVLEGAPALGEQGEAAFSRAAQGAQEGIAGVEVEGPAVGRLFDRGENADAGELPLAGMSVVVTGSMSGVLEALTRNQMNELIERAGGGSSSSLSVKTSLLVAGEKAGSKRAKAESLGVRIAGPFV